MKNDIPDLKVQGVGIAVVPEKDELGNKAWYAYLINMRPEPLQNAIVATSGYGDVDGRKLETTTLRYFLGDIPAESTKKIEPLMEEVFKLTNQYWLSYGTRGQLYDKRYIFVRDSISESNMIDLPLLDTKGVLIL